MIRLMIIILLIPVNLYSEIHINEIMSSNSDTIFDEFGESTGVGLDNALFNDYGQLYNTRQFFKYDFDPEFTKRFINKTYGRTH